jgi:hypothetical protein
MVLRGGAQTLTETVTKSNHLAKCLTSFGGKHFSFTEAVKINRHTKLIYEGGQKPKIDLRRR